MPLRGPEPGLRLDTGLGAGPPLAPPPSLALALEALLAPKQPKLSLVGFAPALVSPTGSCRLS